MLVIGLIALIVVGPERLPQVARTIGNLIGYLSRQVRNIREEIRQPVENEFIDIKGKFNDTIREVTDIEPVKEKPEQSPPKQHVD